MMDGKKIIIWSLRLCREKNNNSKDNKDKNSNKKKTLNAHLNDLWNPLLGFEFYPVP